MVEQNTEPLKERLQVSEYSIFYEIVDGNLLRRMEPIELTFSRVGEGRRVIILHSVGGPLRTLEGPQFGLAGGYELVALDLRGFGASARPTHDYTVDLWADDVCTLLGVLGGEPPVLYGHGAGAAIALTVAARTAVAGIAVSGLTRQPGQPSALTPVAEAGDRGDDIAPALGELIGDDLVRADLTPQIVARAISAWQAADLEAAIGKIDAPVLALAGEQDTVTPPAEAEALARSKGGRFVLLPAAHELPVLCPRQVATSLTTWIEEEVA